MYHNEDSPSASCQSGESNGSGRDVFKVNRRALILLALLVVPLFYAIGTGFDFLYTLLYAVLLLLAVGAGWARLNLRGLENSRFPLWRPRPGGRLSRGTGQHHEPDHGPQVVARGH